MKRNIFLELIYLSLACRTDKPVDLAFWGRCIKHYALCVKKEIHQDIVALGHVLGEGKVVVLLFEPDLKNLPELSDTLKKSVSITFYRS